MSGSGLHIGEDTPLPYTGVAELRVHGVSGTLPQDLLDRIAVRQVAGDHTAGFYRPTLADELRDHPISADPSAGGPWLEAYSWGGLTSGAKTRAFWLALFPFALVNVAPRMLPPKRVILDSPPVYPVPDDCGVGWAHEVATALIRLVAISLTIAITFGVSEVGLISVGWRCVGSSDHPTAGAPTCFGLPAGLLTLVASWPTPLHLVFGLLVPALVVFLLWLLSGRTVKRYERVTFAPNPTKVDNAEPAAPEAARMPLLRSDLWQGELRVRRLRRLHVQCACTVVLAMTAHLFPPGGFHAAAVWAAVAGMIVTAVLATVWTPDTRHQQWTKMMKAEWAGTWAVTGVSTILTALLFVTAGHAELAGNLEFNEAVGYFDTFELWFFVAQSGVVTVLFGLAAGLSINRMKVDPPHRAPMRLWGLGAFVFTFLGWLTGTLLTSAVMLLAPIWLFTKGFSFRPGIITAFLADSQYSGWFGSATLSTGYGMLAAVTIFSGTCLLFATGLKIFRRFSTSTLVDRVTWLMVPMTALLVVFLIIQGLGRFLPEKAGWWFIRSGRWVVLPREVDARQAVPVPGAVAWGAVGVVGFLLGLILLATLAYRTLATRKSVGVFWDLACFWPRDIHPFSPPCYSERAVPELQERIHAYQAAGTKVVVAAHSQGTIITAAALLG